MDPALPLGLAIGMALFAAALWGSWAVSLKYLGDFPLEGFNLTIFTASLVFVWMVGFLLDGPALLGNIQDILATDPIRVAVTLICGFVYVNGIRLSVIVQHTIGLSLAQPIQSSIILLVGTFVSAFVGGIPEGVSLQRIFIACLVLIAAVTSAMLAGLERSRNQNLFIEQASSGLRITTADLRRSLKYVLLTSLLVPAYTLGLSFGLRSSTHPQGLAVLPFMALLATGAFFGSMASSGVSLTRRREWQRVFDASMYYHKFGILSGLFHHGGNIVHTFATVQLSTVISWPLGLTGGLWTQLWGLMYGEFKGASRKAYGALILAICLYLIGAMLIANTLYR